MRRILIALVLSSAFALPVIAQPLDWEAFLQVAGSGVSDEAVYKVIDKRGLNFDLSVDHLRQLKAAGRTHAFLTGLLKVIERSHAVPTPTPEDSLGPVTLVPAGAKPRGAMPPAPAPTAPPAPSPDVIVPRTEPAPVPPALSKEPLPPGTREALSTGGPAMDFESCAPPGQAWIGMRRKGLTLSEASIAFQAGQSAAAAGDRSQATRHWIWAARGLLRQGSPSAACAMVREVLTPPPPPPEPEPIPGAVPGAAGAPPSTPPSGAPAAVRPPAGATPGGTSLAEVPTIPPPPPFLTDSDYACALRVASEVRSRITCPFPDPQTLAARDITRLPANVVAIHGYLVGRDLIEAGGDPERARLLVELVPADDPDYPGALFQRAMIEIRRQMYRSATRALLMVVEAGQEKVDGVSLSDLARLTLARVAFENRLFHAAIYYYALVPPTSRLWLVATAERAFAHLMAENHAAALGAVVALEGFKDVPWTNLPDISLIRAEALAHACQFAEARNVAEKARIRVEDLQKALAGYAPIFDRLAAPFCDFACVKSAAEQLSVEPTLAAIPALAGDAGVRRGFMALNQTLQEMAQVQADPGARPLAEPLWRQKETYLAYLRLALIEGLKAHRDTLDATHERLTEFVIDVDSAEKDFLMYRVREMAETEGGSRRDQFVKGCVDLARKGLSGDEIISFAVSRSKDLTLESSDLVALRLGGVPMAAVDYIASSLVRRPDYRAHFDPMGVDLRVIWDFDREFWSDELNGFRVELPNMCRAGMRFSGPGAGNTE